MATALKRAIVFVGFMGAGKSGAAREAAAALGTEPLDADQLLERDVGEPIADFWEREGEAAFREREERMVLELLAGSNDGVIALGGGAVESAAVREALRPHLPVWCRVSEATAWSRASESGRPLAAERDEFARRFEARASLYEEVAHGVLPLDRSRDSAAAAAPWLAAVTELPDPRLVWGSSESSEYPAVVADGALSLLPASGERRWFAIADTGALAHHSALLPPTDAVIEVEGSEERKTLAEAERVLRELAAAGARRDDGVLAFGGGVVGDLAGFCAASYQRGVDLVQAPTTLVAQVDSAYGGKTGVDLPEAKNYVGAYHMPTAVLAEPRVLDTLPAAELRAGLAEVVKTALIAGGRLWERVRSTASPDPASLAEVIFACARTKLDVVAEDERDSGRRAVLNLGHTVGHAIEQASGYARYRHGEAVALGLLAALRLSGADGLRDEVEALLERWGLPVRLDSAVALEDVLAAVERDKKRRAQGVGFVLLERAGEPRVAQPVDAGSLRAAVEELRSE